MCRGKRFSAPLWGQLPSEGALCREGGQVTVCPLHCLASGRRLSFVTSCLEHPEQIICCSLVWLVVTPATCPDINIRSLEAGLPESWEKKVFSQMIVV